VTEIESRRHPTWQREPPPASVAAWLTEVGVVGLGRFELPTSPLSGVRSNQLSYRPGIPIPVRSNPSATLLQHMHGLQPMAMPKQHGIRGKGQIGADPEPAFGEDRAEKTDNLLWELAPGPARQAGHHFWCRVT
jgi:hypothetical protein